MLGLLGCASSVPPPEARKPRPVAGDTVSPLLLLGKSWKQGGPVLLSVRLQVQSGNETEPRLLQLEDIPYKTVPGVNLTFYRENEQIHYLEKVPLVRDC